MDEESKRKMDKMHQSLYGDEEMGVIGMIKKVDTIYEVFTKINSGFSIIGWVVGSIIVFGIFLGTIKAWLVTIAHYLLTK